MKRWTVRLELDSRDADLGHLRDVLVDYHPTVGRTMHGRIEVTVTITGESLRQAFSTAIAVTADATGSDIRAVEILPSEDFNSHHTVERVPELLSVTETAAELGVTPQAVRQRLDGGTIAGTKIGSTWAVPRAEVLRLKAAAVPTARPPAYRSPESR